MEAQIFTVNAIVFYVPRNECFYSQIISHDRKYV